MRTQQLSQVMETISKIYRIERAISSVTTISEACSLVGLHKRTYNRYKKNNWKLRSRYQREIDKWQDALEANQ